VINSFSCAIQISAVQQFKFKFVSFLQLNFAKQLCVEKMKGINFLLWQAKEELCL
jgi:hypothetical protein